MNVGGTLYGTTYGGGAGNAGTVFRLNPTTGAETVLHGFTRGADGSYPYAALTAVKGLLYGTTYRGGAVNGGTIFSVNPTSGAENVLHSFGVVAADGTSPSASFTNVKGTLYGTTVGGGHNYGTVYRFNPNTAAETTLYAFQGGSDGVVPEGAVQYVNGVLYGTTLYGGTGNNGNGFGTVFALNPTTGNETVLYPFQGTPDGAGPQFVHLINGANGTLFGTTENGGANRYDGTVFAVSPTGVESELYAFSGPDGAFPFSGLLQINGTFYGTTLAGGAYGYGTVFELCPHACP